jgi:hypothetical protein
MDSREHAMPRFVVLAHDWPHPHFDLLIERDGVLKAWRLPEPPRDGLPVEPLPDHRLFYLDYEGPLTGDRGSVLRIDSGTATWTGSASFQLMSVYLDGEFLVTADSILTTTSTTNASLAAVDRWS